jgi:glycosyltransferase involved in cell wall biosynthesis
VRDGRDAVVSIAHHRKDLVNPGSDFLSNLQEAIIAAEGSFFGGWTKNAESWLQRADLVIKYEDLIANPKKTFERVESFIELPKAEWSKLPDFNAMRSGKPMYGGTSKMSDPKFNPDEFAQKFFRKGKSGGWKEEMPQHYQDLFWNHHGDMMERLGYAKRQGSVEQNELLDYSVMKKSGMSVTQYRNKKYRVFIEATKIVDSTNDGIKRYLESLLNGLSDILKHGAPLWNFKIVIARKIYSLENYKEQIRVQYVERLHTYEKVLMGFKKIVKSLLPVKIYEPISKVYRESNIRSILKVIREKAGIKRGNEFLKQLSLPHNTADLFHIPLPQNYEDYNPVENNFLITVHDLTHKLFPEYHLNTNINLAENGMKFIQDKNANVIAVSDNTRKDLLHHYNFPEEKIHTVYESPDPDLFKWNVNQNRAIIIREKYKLGTKPYFLCQSTIEPRKNLPNTIRAFNLLIEENPQLEINLVISGNFGWKTEHLSKELHLDNPRIIFIGYVDDYDLPVIYSEAVALCYVSFYEGFGLPPLEAMSCRTPVIYGNNSSMTEVIADTGLAADAHDFKNIKEQMHRILFEMDLRDKLAVLSHHRSFTFTSRKNIFDTLMTYKQIIEDSKKIINE